MPKRLYDIAAEKYYEERKKKYGNEAKNQPQNKEEIKTTPIKRQTFAEFASDVQNFARYEAQRKNTQPESTYDQAIEMIRGGGMQNQRAMSSSPENRQFIAQQRERIDAQQRQDYLDELNKNFGYKRVGNQVVYVTPNNPMPRITDANRGTRANAPGAFGIQPSEYVGAMSAFDRFNKLQNEKPNTNPLDEKLTTEARGWVQGYFPEKYKEGQLPTYEDVVQKMQLNPAQQREIWNGYNTFAQELTDAEAVTTDAANRYAQEMDQAQRDRDEALRLLGAGAEKYATGREADYYERFANGYRVDDGNTGETPYLRYGDMDGIDLETAKKYSASPYIERGQGYDLQRWSMTDPEERKKYEVIRRVYGEEEANNYLQSLEGELNQRLAHEETVRAMQFAQENPILANLKTLATAPIRGAGMMEGMAREFLTGEEMDNYDPRLNLTREAEAIRAQSAQNMGGGVKGFLYQTLMSVGDNLANMALWGGLGSFATGLSMFGSSAASAYNDVIDRKGGHEQAMASAVLAGVAEMLFEKFSIDNFIELAKGGGAGNAVLNVFKQMGVEGSEEGATAIANEITDRLIMGEKSNYETKVANLMYFNGMQEEEARKAANIETAKEIGLSVAGGAISGGIMGGVGEGFAYATGAGKQQTPDNQQVIKQAERDMQTTQPIQQPVRVEREVTGQRPAQEANAQPTQQPVRVEREVSGKRPTQDADVSQNVASETMGEEQEAKTEKPVKTAENAKAGKPFRVEREVKVRRNGIEQSMTVTGVEEANGKSIFLRARNEDGETEIVSAADAEFVDPVQQELMNYRGITRMDALGLRNYLDGYDAGIATPEQYARAYESAYMDGKAGLGYERMVEKDGQTTQFLTSKMRQIAYAAGERQLLLNARSAKYQQMVTDALNKAAGGRIRFVDEDISENGYYDPKTGEIVISTNADKGAYAYIAVHELGHKLRAENETAWGSFKELVVDALLVNDVDIDERIAHTKELYKQRGRELTTEQALEEVICNSAAAILQDEQIVKDMVKKNRPLMERVAEFLREFVDKLAKTITKAGEDMSGLGSWKQLDALRGDHENLQKIYQSLMSALEDTQKQENHSDAEDGMVRMSVQEMPDGERYVEVDTDQNIFEGHSPKEYPRIVRDYIKNHFRGTVIGEGTNRAYVDSTTFQEYTNPAKALEKTTFEAKMKAATELDNMMKASEYYGHNEPNMERHPEFPGGFDLYDVVFRVAGEVFQGRLNIGIDNRNRKRLYDLTKIKNLDAGIWVKQHETAAQTSTGSINSIPEEGKNVNVKMSVKEDNEGNRLSEEQQEYFANSKVRDENGNLKVMHHGTANDFTVFNPMLQGGKNGVAEEYGIYFTDTASITDTYGGKRMSGYLNITHPAKSTEKTIKANVLAKLIKATCEAEAEKWVADGDYDNVEDALKDTWVSNYEYTYDSPMSTIYRKVASGIIAGEDSDMGIVQEIMAGTAVRSYEDAYQFYDILKETTGIDGFITEWDNAEIPGKKAQIALAFDSNQFKNLDNKAPSNNPDIRYSFRESSEAVQEELEQTADAFEQVRHGHSITPAEADNLAGKLIKEANSTFDRTEAAQEIARIYDYIENAEAVDMEYVDDMQTRLMSRILEKSRVLDEEHEQLVDPIREYFKGTRIRLTDAQREEAANIAGSYGAYARSLFGRVKLSRMGGMALDVAWSELGEILPEWFPEANEGDMPGMLLQLVDAIKPVYNTGMNTEEMASWLAGKLNDAYLNLPAVKAAARNQKGFIGSVKEMRAALKRFEETSAEEFKAALEAVRKSDKLKTASEREEHERAIMEKYRKMRERENAQRRATELRAKQRGRTEAFARTMINWLDKPTDAKHIPAGLEEPLRDVLSALDFSGKNTKVATQLASRIEKLAEVLEGAQEGEDENRTIFLERDQQMLDELRRVAVLIRGNTEGRGVYDLNGLELKELNKWLGVVKHVLTGASKMRGSNFDVDVQQVAAESIYEISRKKPMKDKKWITKQWENLFAVDMMDSFTFFERLGRTSTKVFEGLRTGFDQMARHVKQAETYTKQLLKDFNLKTVTGRKAKKQTFELESGRTIEMTRAQIMELYVLNKREQARGHIYGDGILVRGDEDAHAHAVTEQDVAKITSALTEEEKKIADGMQKFLSKICAQWGNETSLKLLGYKKFGEENYWPISTDPNTRNTTRLEDNFAANISAIKNQGMTKQLIEGARNAIMIGDVFDTYTRHISNMAAYSAYAVPLSDFTRWYNSRGLKTEIAHTMGQKGLTYINNLLMAINGTAQKSPLTGPEKIAGVMARNAKTAAVGANLRVAIQQPTSYARAAMYINEKYLAAALGKKIKNAELVDKYCGIAAWKRYGFRETNIGPNLREMIVGDKSALEKGRELSMKLAEAGDNWTLNRLWVACELETNDLMPELEKGTEAYYQHVGKRMSEIVDRTQVVDSPFHRSQMMRSKSYLAQTLTNFMSEPTKTFNMLMGAVYDYADNRKNPAAKKRLARTMVVYGVSTVLTAAAAGIVDAFRDSDDEKEWLEKYLDAVMGNTLDGINPLGMIPLVRDVLSTMEGYDSNRLDQQSIQRIVWAYQEIKKFADGESKQNIYGVAYKVAQALSSTLGIPLSNALRETNALIQTVTGMSPTLNTEAQKASYINQLYAAMQKGDAKDQAKIRAKLRADAGLNPKEIDTAIAAKLSYDERIAAAYEAKKAGKIGDVNRAKNALAHEGFTGEMVDKAIADYGNRVDPKEKREKDMDAQLSARAYTYDEAMTAINAGASIADIKAMMSDMAADSDAKDPEKSVRSELKGKIKQEYMAAWKKGDKAKMNSLKTVLTDAIEMEEKEIDEWIVEQHRVDLRSAVDAYDGAAAKKAIAELRKAGKTDSNIKGSLDKYKQLYIDAMKAGDRQTAQKIKKMLMGLGLTGEKGKPLYTEDTFEGWLKK